MTVSDADFELVRQLVYEDAGIVLEPDKHYLVDSRLRRLGGEGEDPMTEVMARLHLGEDAQLRAAVVQAMAIQETYFFRDPWLFDSLRTEVIPELMQRRASERSLRIWCAASSTGQEIYSICLMLREHFPELLGWRLELVASDFSEDALQRARTGRYSMPEVNRGLPARLLMSNFSQRGLEWELHAEVRRMVDFKLINLVDDWPELPLFDVVLLRNVLIYFDNGTRRDVLTRVRATMRSDAFLFMGGTESPLGLVDDFIPGAERSIYFYRVNGRDL